MNSESNKLSFLKEQLTQELAKANSDNIRILELSNKIAELDETKVRFSVDAGIINRLGKELMGKVETAVSELVKNSYDADATKVFLTFENCDVIGGKLTIADNGLGMTREQLISGFMRISSSEKITSPHSFKFNRKRAGQKGIGRFATQRLGERLKIITKTEKSTNSALQVTINWNDFESKSNLLLIQNQIETTDKLSKRREGTDLVIDNLRDVWSDPMIRRVYRYISEILQPFPLSKTLEENKQDPGFEVICRKKVNNEYIIIADTQTSFYEYAVAEIEGKVDGNGFGEWFIQSNKFEELKVKVKSNISKEDKFAPFGIDRDEFIPFKELKNIHFKIYYFIFTHDLIPSLQLNNIQEVTKEKGGVRVYRNGFRVLPYGENQNDWLGLDESVRRRVVLPSHGNNSFIGFVEIEDDKDNSLFLELSNREGFWENTAYKELVDFVYRVLIEGVIKIASLRGRKQTAGQKDYEKQPNLIPKTIKKTAQDAKKDIELLENTIKQNNNKSNSQNKDEDNSSNTSGFFNSLKNKLNIIESKADESEENLNKLLDENSMLRVLAGLGLVIGEFAHEIKHYVKPFQIDTEFLINIATEYPQVIERAERLNRNAKAFSTYTAYFDRAISSNALRELQPISLRVVVNDFIEIIKPDLSRQNIILHEPIFKGYGLSTIPMHESEIISILFNFYSNSKKAIIKTGKSGEILIEIGRDNNKIYLEFSDNGIGIPLEDDENIFEAFFTTSTVVGHSATYQEELTGTGLGLKIVRDIITSYNGDIYLKRPATTNFKTTIRVELPENKKDE